MRDATLLIVLAVLLGGCSDDPAPDNTCELVQPTLESINANVMTRSCTISNSCHHGSSPEPIFEGPDGEEGSMNLTDPQDLCDQIDRPSISDTQLRPVITCGSCADSYMMIKLDPLRVGEITTSAELHDAYGDQIDATAMPQSSRGLASDPLCQPKIDALCQWINEGCTGCL